MGRVLLSVFLVTLCSWACVGAPQIGKPRARQIPVETFVDPRPEGNELLLDAQIGQLLRSAPSGAKLILTKPQLPPIIQRLADNATLIRPNIVDTFRCEGRVSRDGVFSLVS
ncbi:hypothetical protein Hamer_G018814 [Homarus americanus]|uniref:Uncharacterized protein n=1 Tax=Homarus americanus TaxID=6706 RepID=A0A8J5JHG4_HOMAM|nr:hypothetical protein Hamer_G018814 [Homarus americanus]